MRVFAGESTSRGVQRVITALKQYRPDAVELVDDLRQAELVIIHAIGRANRVRRLAVRCLDEQRRYAVIQYCLRSTLQPHCSAWRQTWEHAACVWSYYHLPLLCDTDNVPALFEFYHAPLGVDARIFFPLSDSCRSRRYAVATSGPAWTAESVRECAIAADGHPVVHIGRNLGRKEISTYLVDVADTVVADHLRDSRYVSGLRRTEGFELPAAEGLLCGARPVLFDRPHYRQWYGDSGVYIPEGPRPQVVDDLRYLFRQSPSPVLPAEQNAAARRFDWATIIRGFWARL